MAKASNPFPELVRSHGGVCIFPGILWQLVRNKVYEEYAVHAHLAWCQTCLIVLSENSRSFALKSNWVPLLPISWDFYQTRVKYTVSQKRINRMLLKPWFIGSIISNRTSCVKIFFGCFLLRLLKHDHALQSRFYGKILPHSTQFWLGYFFFW